MHCQNNYTEHLYIAKVQERQLPPDLTHEKLAMSHIIKLTDLIILSLETCYFSWAMAPSLR